MSGGSAIGGWSSWLLERVDESDEALASCAPFVTTITVSPIERVSRSCFQPGQDTRSFLFIYINLFGGKSQTAVPPCPFLVVGVGGADTNERGRDEDAKEEG